MLFNFKRKPIGITCTFDKDDPRLKAKEDVCCAYVGMGGKIKHKTVSVTQAEKQVIECIAMRLFMDHKKVVVEQEPDSKGRVRLTGVITVDLLEKTKK